VNGPPFLRSPLLAATGVGHAFFTRQGGVSQGPYESLNAGYGSRDEAANVAENRRRAIMALGHDPSELTIAYQVHSGAALVAERPWGSRGPTGDAVVSGSAGVVCGVLTADCAPVLIADREARVVAAVHAGWRGALGGIVASAVAAMTGLGARPSRMVAAVGPCIAQTSYEVGPEFLARFESQNIDAQRFFVPGASGRLQFDLAGFVATRLAESGVAQCDRMERDTAGETTEFFSYRRALRAGDEDYGRLLSVIALELG
jgi:hypothetical protein